MIQVVGILFKKKRALGKHSEGSIFRYLIVTSKLNLAKFHANFFSNDVCIAEGKQL